MTNGLNVKSGPHQTLMYYYIHKPYNMLSQFSPEGGYAGLGDLFPFPPDVYPLGRLDADSEGLLILTNDTGLNQQLLNPRQAHWRTYWVQVEGDITTEALQSLRQGVEIKVQKKIYKTLPAQAGVLPEGLPDRTPPIRYRKHIPTSWIYLRLREGKNRQVRRMTAAVGFPTLRLVRMAIEGLELKDMQPGDVRAIAGEQLYKLLNIDPSNTGTGSGASARRFSSGRKRK